MEARGVQNIGCTKTDIYNYERLLYEHFESEQEKNSPFTFKIKGGNDDRIMHCFWADAISKRVYKYFGVNYHEQSIVFACAFLSDEITDSFLWLFDQFKETMPDSAPKMIITDQNPAMTKAIAQAFPNTYYRFSESYHSFFKKYVSKKNSLMDFILRFNRALAHQRHEELIADHTDSNGKPVLKLQMMIVMCIKLIKGMKLLIELEKSFVKSQVVLHHAVISVFQDKSMLTCRTRLFQLASNVIENVVGSEETSKILEDYLNNILSKVKSMVRNDSISERHSSTPQIYNKSLAVRAKGCGKRLKGGKEKRCNGCGKVGQSHNKRNFVQSYC
ncbi:hypothetical protein ACOSQ2_021076 [Xanthoceras sorbifolium]